MILRDYFCNQKLLSPVPGLPILYLYTLVLDQPKLTTFAISRSVLFMAGKLLSYLLPITSYYLLSKYTSIYVDGFNDWVPSHAKCKWLLYYYKIIGLKVGLNFLTINRCIYKLTEFAPRYNIWYHTS